MGEVVIAVNAFPFLVVPVAEQVTCQTSSVALKGVDAPLAHVQYFTQSLSITSPSGVVKMPFEISDRYVGDPLTSPSLDMVASPST